MISTYKARRVLIVLVVGSLVAGLVDLCGLDDSQEPRTGDEVRAVRPSPTPVSVPVTLDELVRTEGRRVHALAGDEVRGSVATEVTVEEDAGDTQAAPAARR